MQTLLKYLSAGALSLVSLGALSSAPAIAASINVTSIGGTASDDYLVYDANGTNTFEVAKTLANIQNVLGGDAASPTGNVELRARTEKPEFDPTKPEFDPTAFTKNTTLSGAIGGKSITLSSLTKSDWAVVGKTWFSAALTANGYGAALIIDPNAYQKFVDGMGQQRFSDPNISYVNQDDNNGVISIGLAGHYDATDLLFASLSPSDKNLMIESRDLSKVGTPVQASELVKYTYDGQSGYLFSFSATQTGLVALDDRVSHDGNYEVTLRGAKPVPVPAAFVGIAIAGAIGAAKLKRSKVNIKA